MSEKLLPCPFCGGKARLRYLKPLGWVQCKKCGATSATVSDYYEETDGKGQAVAAWNRRAQPDNSRQRALQTGICPMCEDCPDGCPVEAPNDSRNKPENEPLTLSELYDIDSEPLYFHCMVGHWSLNGWHIVKAINYDGAQFKDVQLDNNDAHIESLYNYGITWLAYRAKPERSEG